MFDYDPMSEEDAQKARFQLLPEGEYEGVIDKAEARISPNGNKMIVLDITIFDENGKPNPIKDFLVFSPKMMWKVRHCMDCCGLLKEYEEKKFIPELLVGQTVRVIIGAQEGNIIPVDKLKGKPYGSKYPDKNVINDYVKKDDQKPVSKPQADHELNDDIPF